MKKILAFLLFSVVFVGLFCSCSPKAPEHYIACFLESPKQAGTFELQREYVLPVIDKQIRVGRDPIFNIDAFSDCVVSEKYDPVFESATPGLFFRIKDDYALRLRQVAARGEGRRLLLVADGKPLGFCTLRKDFTRNDLFFFIITSTTGEEERLQLEDLCFELNGYILEFREYKERQ